MNSNPNLLSLSTNTQQFSQTGKYFYFLIISLKYVMILKIVLIRRQKPVISLKEEEVKQSCQGRVDAVELTTGWGTVETKALIFIQMHLNINFRLG